jgi:hypothetical protein
MTKAEIKTQVGTLVAQGETTQGIAKKLGLTHNQVTHIRSYYFGKERSPQERAWDKRRANTTEKVSGGISKVTKRQVIRLGDITIEFERGSTKRAIIGLDGSLTIK